jgi:hypothetical protein
MTRTPTTTVTAIAMAIDPAARAFAWGAFDVPGGRRSGMIGALPPSQSPLH